MLSRLKIYYIYKNIYIYIYYFSGGYFYMSAYPPLNVLAIGS